MRSTTRALLIMSALALVVAACGDDDATTSTAAGVDTATVTAGTSATATSSATASTSGSTDGGSGGDIDDLLARFEVTPLRTTYLIGEGDDQTELILAQDPTADPPIEAITIVDNDTKIIISADVTILCDGSSGTCFEIPGAGGDSLAAGFLGPFGFLLGLGSEGPLGSALSEETATIAGREGVCLTYEPPAEFGAETDFVRQCIDNELGFTLLLQSSEAGSDDVETIMELIDFAPPTPEDFEPTGPVIPNP